MEAVAKPGVVSPAIAVCETFGIEGRESSAEFMAALDKFPPSAVAAHLYEAGYRPTSNAHRSVSKPSDEGLRKTQKALRGKGFTPGDVYAHACACDSRKSRLSVSAAIYKALKDLVLRFGAAPSIKKSANGKGAA